MTLQEAQAVAKQLGDIPVIAIASIVRTKVVEHALWRPVNNQRHPDIC